MEGKEEGKRKKKKNSKRAHCKFLGFLITEEQPEEKKEEVLVLKTSDY